MNDEKVSNVETLKVKYPLLKKEGYKLNYGNKTNEYIDIFFIKKIDDTSSLTIHISEKRVAKRYEGSNYNNNVEALTVKEVLAIAEIISQLKLTSI